MHALRYLAKLHCAARPWMHFRVLVNCETEIEIRSAQRDLLFTVAEVYIEHPLLVVVPLLYVDHMLYGGALQTQRVGSAVQHHQHLITRTVHFVIAPSLLELVGLYDGGGG